MSADSERGSALVDFLLVALLVTVLVLGVIQVALTSHVRNVLIDAAAEGARAHNDPPVIPTAEIDFLAAQIAAGMGNASEARELAERALETAGETTAAQIESFLQQLGEE